MSARYRITLEIDIYSASSAVAALGALVDRDIVFTVTSESGAQFDLMAQRPIRGGICCEELAARSVQPL